MDRSHRVAKFDILSEQLNTSDMPAQSTLNVSLTPELERFVQERVSSGRYQTASEVVREGLRLLESREHERQLAFNTLKSKLQRAAAQADAGEFADPDELLKKIKSRRAR